MATKLNIYQKLIKARITLGGEHNEKLLNNIAKSCDELAICPILSTTQTATTLTIVDADSPESTIVFSIPNIECDAHLDATRLLMMCIAFDIECGQEKIEDLKPQKIVAGSKEAYVQADFDAWMANIGKLTSKERLEAAKERINLESFSRSQKEELHKAVDSAIKSIELMADF